ncbi:MAG: hypothetical protein E7J78_15115, partial [Pantoea sp.]|nr:hypothetical protein [Pantoea sp.]
RLSLAFLLPALAVFFVALLPRLPITHRSLSLSPRPIARQSVMLLSYKARITLRCTGANQHPASATRGTP